MMNPSLEWVTSATTIEEDPYDNFRIRELDPVGLPQVTLSSGTYPGALLLCFYASQLGFPHRTKRYAVYIEAV
jgi:hypothetical protein